MNDPGLFSPWISHRWWELQPVIVQGFVVLLLPTSVARVGDAAMVGRADVKPAGQLGQVLDGLEAVGGDALRCRLRMLVALSGGDCLSDVQR